VLCRNEVLCKILAITVSKLHQNYMLSTHFLHSPFLCLSVYHFKKNSCVFWKMLTGIFCWKQRTSLNLLATLFLMHPRMPLAFLATRAHCWLMVNLSSTRTPRSLSAELLSSRSAPACTGAGVFPPQVQDPALALVQLHQVPLRPTLKPVHVSLNGSTAFHCIHHSSQLCSKLAEGIF